MSTDTMKRLLSYSFLTFLLIGVSGCYTVPKTGRSALILVSERKLAAASADEFVTIKISEPVSVDPDYNARVQKVGQRIAEVAKQDIAYADWEFIVIEDDDMMNAFAMPGGKVAVYTGLLKITKSDDELAIVIGHEVAHVAARHSNERLSQKGITSVFLNLSSIALSVVGLGFYESQAVLSAVGAGAEFGLMLPYSRQHENEADVIGLLYAAEAGYDPYAAITFWERVKAMSEEDDKFPAFLSTHPSDETRIRKLWVQMPEAVEIYRDGQPAAAP